MGADRTDLVKLKEVLNRWQNGLRETSWNCLFWGNHDQPRAVSKFGCDLPEYRGAFSENALRLPLSHAGYAIHLSG